VRKNLIPTDQVGGLINSVHATLSGLGNEIVEEPPRVPAVSIRRSVHPDYLICIECGYRGKMLKKHIKSRHGLSVDEYKTRWKLPSDYSTTAANYSRHRSQLAKQIGLGRTRAQPEATSEKPARSARKTSTKATEKSSAKKASVKKISRSRKPSRAASKAKTAPEGAIA
jgi:predicted transcriptional regulator